MIHRHALVGLALIGALTVLPACASKSTSTTAEATPVTTAESSSEDAAFYAEEYKDGRYYVFGQAETHSSWKANGHMPYTRTQIGSGPYGATVVYEIDKDWPELTDWLEQKFEYEHWSPEPPYFAVQQHEGRVYAFGNAATHESFMKHHHMPYTRTQIGGGPGGMTVVYEIDKKDPALTDWLEREYASRRSPAPVASGTAPSFYAETMKEGRYYVFGNAQTEDAFRKNGHMPYTRTLIGAGPGGKTVVLEVDNKDDSVADRLESEFDRRHGLRR